MRNASLTISLFGLLAVSLGACAQQANTSATTTSQQPSAQTPASSTDTKKNMQDVAILDTNLGEIDIAFFADKAPGHVKNFIDLAKKGFYDGTKFHRVIPGFMIQGGDPNSKDEDRSNDGTGGPGYSIKAEFNDTSHVPGIVSMARSSDPNSAGSQFFIVVGDAKFLDGQYTAFGRVIKGMDVANKIVQLPRDERDNPLPGNPAIIKSVKIVQQEVAP
jgi:peptidyl-prolyl cis-trans isomerase B (cyclophilin B)